MIEGQGEDSCGKSRSDETPQARKRRGGLSATRGKRSLAWKSTVVSQVIYTSSLLPVVRLRIRWIEVCLNLFFACLVSKLLANLYSFRYHTIK
ncbi:MULTISPECIES: hypothetical protein [Priestia]|uniref:hypothetical protein n=1 Tax=Priestia TaxID=2800373 RepID=UPI001C8EA858|nr:MULTISPECIES: hypothetical protein [Priestia]MBX9988471.1 hypothetical protein [Priestia aryabhattai]UYV53911.1 hypothetical protein OHU65_04810 [Priestia megaterium]